MGLPKHIIIAQENTAEERIKRWDTTGNEGGWKHEHKTGKGEGEGGNGNTNMKLGKHVDQRRQGERCGAGQLTRETDSEYKRTQREETQREK